MFTLVDVMVAAGQENRVDRLSPEHRALSFSGAAIDSRLVKPGELFVALVGERHDGHDYVDAAFANGAAVALIRRDSAYALKRGPELDAGIHGDTDKHFLVTTDDTLAALHRLASNHRAKFDLPVIGITGSVGKTSTKEAVAAVLQERFTTLKTPRSYNSESTMPLTILQLEPEASGSGDRDGDLWTWRDCGTGVDRATKHRHRDQRRRVAHGAHADYRDDRTGRGRSHRRPA